MRWLPVFFLATGCQALFPELYPTVDAATDSDGGTAVDLGGPHVSGSVCAIADVRDWKSCATLAAQGLKVEVEETTDAAMTDATGHFYLASRVQLTTATLLVIDPRGQYAETVAPIDLSTAPDGIALPVIDAQAVANMAQSNGIPADPTHGTLLGWTIDSAAMPVSGVSVVGQNALYEGSAANEVGVGSSTGAHGLFALFDLPAPSLQLSLSPPATNVQLPIRAAAVTMTTVVVR
jgi:hypothetical protein